MSAGTDTQSRSSKPGPKLDEAQRLAIVAQALAGTPKSTTARQFGVHPNTVHNLLNKAVDNGAQAEKVPAAARFDALKDKAIVSVERALDDDSDVFKSAGVAQTHLKGIGVYSSDAAVVNNTIILQQIAALPEDERAFYLSTDDDVIEVTPERDAL